MSHSYHPVSPAADEELVLLVKSDRPETSSECEMLQSSNELLNSAPAEEDSTPLVQRDADESLAVPPSQPRKMRLRIAAAVAVGFLLIAAAFIIHDLRAPQFSLRSVDINVNAAPISSDSSAVIARNAIHRLAALSEDGSSGEQAISIPIATSFLFREGPRHVEIDLHNAICSVYAQRGQEEDQDHEKKLFDIATNIDEDDKLALEWSEPVSSDSPPIALNFTVSSFDFPAMRDFIYDLTIADPSSITATPALRFDCAARARVKLFGVSLGSYSHSQDFTLVIDSAVHDHLASMVKPKDDTPETPQVDADQTPATSATFSFDLPFRLPRTGLFSSLSSFRVHTPAMHYHLHVDASRFDLMDRVGGPAWGQAGKWAHAAGADGGLSIRVPAADLEFASPEDNDDVAPSTSVIAVDLRPVIGHSMSQDCATPRIALPSTLHTSLAFDLLSCTPSSSNNVVSELVGSHHLIEFVPHASGSVFPPPPPPGPSAGGDSGPSFFNGTSTYCILTYLNARAIFGVSACFEISFTPSTPTLPFVQSLDLQVNVSRFMQVHIAEQTSLFDTSLTFSADSSIIYSDEPISFAHVDLGFGILESGSFVLAMQESHLPLEESSDRRIQTQHSGEWSWVDPALIVNAGGTIVFENELVSNDTMQVNLNTGTQVTQVGFAHDDGDSPTIPKYSGGYTVAWTDPRSGDSLTVTVSGAAMQYADVLSNADLTFIFATPEYSTQVSIDLVETGLPGPIDPATARIVSRYSGVFSDPYQQQSKAMAIAAASAGAPLLADSAPFQFFLNGATSWNGESLTSLHANFSLVSAENQVSFNLTEGLEQDETRAGFLLGVTWSTLSGLAFSVASELFWAFECLSNAMFQVNVDTNDRYVAVKLQDTPAPSNTEAASSSDSLPLPLRLDVFYSTAYNFDSSPYGMDFSGSTAWNQQVLTNMQATVEVDTVREAIKLELMEGAEEMLSPENSNIAVSYNATYTIEDGFGLHVNGSTSFQAELLAYAVLELQVLTSAQNYSLSLVDYPSLPPTATGEAASNEEAAPQGRTIVEYHGDFLTGDIAGASITGQTSYEGELQTNAHAAAYLDMNTNTMAIYIDESDSPVVPIVQPARFGAHLVGKFLLSCNFSASSQIWFDYSPLSSANASFLVDPNTHEVRLAVVERQAEADEEVRFGAQYDGDYEFAATPYVHLNINGSTTLSGELVTDLSGGFRFNTQEYAGSINFEERAVMLSGLYDVSRSAGDASFWTANGTTTHRDEILSNATLTFLLHQDTYTIELSLRESTGPIDPEACRISSDYTGSYSSGPSGSLRGHTSWNTEPLTSLEFAFSILRGNISVEMFEGVGGNLRENARVGGAIETLWSMDNGFALVVSEQLSYDSQSITHAVLNFTVDTNEDTASISLVESRDPFYPIPDDQARLSIAYETQWHFEGPQPYLIVITGQTVWDYELASVVEAGFSLDTGAKTALLVVNEGLVKDPAPDNSRLSLSYETAWLTVDGFSLDVRGNISTDGELRTNDVLDVSFNNTSSAPILTVVFYESPSSTPMLDSRVFSNYTLQYQYDLGVDQVYSVAAWGQTYYENELETNVEANIGYNSNAQAFSLTILEAQEPSLSLQDPMRFGVQLDGQYLDQFQTITFTASETISFFYSPISAGDLTFKLDYSPQRSASLTIEEAAQPGPHGEQRFWASEMVQWKFEGEQQIYGFVVDGGVRLAGDTVSAHHLTFNYEQGAFQAEISETNRAPFQPAFPSRFGLILNGTYVNDVQPSASIIVSGVERLAYNYEEISTGSFGWNWNQASKTMTVSLAEAERQADPEKRIDCQYTGQYAFEEYPYMVHVSGVTSQYGVIESNAFLQLDIYESSASVEFYDNAQPSITPTTADYSAVYTIDWELEDPSQRFFGAVDGQVTGQGGETLSSLATSLSVDSGYNYVFNLTEQSQPGPLDPSTADLFLSYSGLFDLFQWQQVEVTSKGGAMWMGESVSNMDVVFGFDWEFYNATLSFVESLQPGVSVKDLPYVRHGLGFEFDVGGIPLIVTNALNIPVDSSQLALPMPPASSDSLAPSSSSSSVFPPPPPPPPSGGGSVTSTISAAVDVGAFAILQYRDYFDVQTILLLNAPSISWALTRRLPTETALTYAARVLGAALDVPLGVAFGLQAENLAPIQFAAMFGGGEAPAPTPSPFVSSSTGPAPASSSSSSTGDWSSSSSSSTGSNEPSQPASGLSMSAKIGIGIGASVGGIALIGLVWLLCLKAGLCGAGAAAKRAVTTDDPSVSEASFGNVASNTGYHAI